MKFHDQSISQIEFMAEGSFAPPQENTGTKKPWWNRLIVLKITEKLLKLGSEI